jgi:hypothetical protein
MCISLRQCNHFSTDGHVVLLYGGCVALASMAVLNLAFILDATAKLVKFMKMKEPVAAEDKAAEAASCAPGDGSPKALRLAAASLPAAHRRCAAALVGMARDKDGKIE